MIDAEIKLLIENTVSVTLARLGKDGFPFCLLENSRVTNVETQQAVLRKIVTGNGNPEDGLVAKHAVLEVRQETDHKTIAEIRSGIWAVAVIGLGLFMTSLWQIISR